MANSTHNQPREATDRAVEAWVRVVDDISDNAFKVTVMLTEIKGAEAGGTLAMVGIKTEDGSYTLTLCPNHSSHFRLDKICHCRQPWLNEEEGS